MVMLCPDYAVRRGLRGDWCVWNATSGRVAQAASARHGALRALDARVARADYDRAAARGFEVRFSENENRIGGNVTITPAMSPAA
jgi:hypothetical protein